MVKNKPIKSSEKAWFEKRQRISNKRKDKKWPCDYKSTFLERVREMRWYCIDSRSYLMLRIHPRRFINGNYTSAVYGQWPKHIE